MRTVPTCADFESAPIHDRYDDMINPPGLTNLVATAQAEHDVLAVCCVQAPPIGQGLTVTGQLILDGRLARSWGQTVEIIWRPDQIRRRTVIDGWDIETVTVMPASAPGVLVGIRVTNTTGSLRTLRLGARLDSAVTCADRPWSEALPPQAANSLAAIPGRAYVAGGDETGARCIQGFDSGAVVSLDNGIVEVADTVASGASIEHTFGLLLSTDQTTERLRGDLDVLLADPVAVIDHAERSWNAHLAALFESDPTEFSGVLPALETSSDALRTLYWWGAMGLAYFRRDNPASVLGRTYDTLMPRYWQTTTFIWDYSLSSLSHALLDPTVMRRLIEHWVELDIHSHFGTEWLTGAPMGRWYSVNDYAMVRLVFDYVRYSGDVDFLAEPIGHGERRRSLIEHVLEWARAWRQLRQPGSELADYGGINNLLECVSTYLHEVASLNAANVWSMRRAADLCELVDMGEQADALRFEAAALVPHVMELYRPGEGFFDVRFPDGRRIPVGHCYDYNLVGSLLGRELDSTQRQEMVQFFRSELQTHNWMRALSPRDGNAGFSVRPDHQWNGAYPAWPADAARATIELGHPEVALQWLEGLSQTAHQGPCGQAHFVDEAANPIAGGARKAPPQWPYLIDWACSSTGAWVQLVIESLFGVSVAPDGTVTASPCVGALDPDAALRGLHVGSRCYDVYADGRVIDVNERGA